MRLLILVFMISLAIGCATSKNTKAKTNVLNGTWIPIQQEMGGTPLSPALYTIQKLTLFDSTYTFVSESIDKGIVKYNDDKMDIYGKQGVNAGKHFTAIYKLEKEQLTICYNLAGDHYPESFATMGKPLYFLSVFKKEMTK